MPTKRAPREPPVLSSTCILTIGPLTNIVPCLLIGKAAPVSYSHPAQGRSAATAVPGTKRTLAAAKLEPGD